MDDLRRAAQEALEAQKAEAPGVGMGPKIQTLYDTLTPLALLIQEIQETSGVSEVTANLALGFSAILRNADDLAVAGIVLDLLWKIADKEASHG